MIVHWVGRVVCIRSHQIPKLNRSYLIAVRSHIRTITRLEHSDSRSIGVDVAFRLRVRCAMRVTKTLEHESECVHYPSCSIIYNHSLSGYLAVETVRAIKPCYRRP